MTAQRDGESELREAAGRLDEVQRGAEAILQAAGVGIIGMDGDGRATFVNRAAAELLGWDPDELLGRVVHDVLRHPSPGAAASPIADRPIFAASGDGRPRTIEDEVLWRRDGTHFHARCIVAAVGAEDGRSPGVVLSFTDITDRRQADAALRESEARVNALMENTAAAVCLKDLAGRILLLNRTAADLYGVRPDDAVGRLDRDLLPAEDAVMVRRTDLQALEAGEPITVQEHYETQVGRRTFLANKFVLRGDDDQPYALGTISTDMTDLERYERELAESRVLLHEAQRVGRIGSFVWDIAAEAISICESASTMLGLPPQEPTTYETIIGLVHPHDRERTDAAFRRAARGGSALALECRVVRPDGGLQVVSAQGSIQQVAGEEGLKLVGSVQDVTDRHRAEQEASRLAVQNEAILRSAGEGIIGVDEDERISFVNPAAANLIGWEAGEILGRPLHAVIHHRHADGAPYPVEKCPVLAVLADGASRSVADEVFWTRDGRAFPVEYIATAIRHEGLVVGGVVTFRDISEARRIERQLQYLADHDSLTGLFNRRRFEEELERHVAHSSRRGSGGAVLLLDLDDFKDVNDTLGHAAGDQLLRKVANILRDRVRAGDTLARLGGDEFALIVADVDARQAQAVADDFCEVVREKAIVASGLRQMRVTTSIGIAKVEAGSTLTAEDLLGYADVALYEAKENGRDRSRIYSAARQARVVARLTETERIRKALREDLFVLYGQPIVDLETGRATRHELLLRMRSGPDGQVVGPGAFLPTAERLGLVVDIDRWVITEAVRLVAERRAAGSRIVVEVNLSGRSLAERDLPGFIEHRLRSAAVDPSQIIFEITETAAIANMDEARAFAETLTRMGCRIALDDFGSGFASYMYLKYLPLDALKIDGDFVRNIARDRTDQLVVEAIVNVAQGLGKETIAECVEDAGTVERLRTYGVMFAQGYHLGRPAPIST